jgi:hypothetical protein
MYELPMPHVLMCKCTPELLDGPQMTEQQHVLTVFLVRVREEIIAQLAHL